MSNPVCPLHHKEMRLNKRGWYCPTPTPSGPTEWCQYKPSIPKPKPERAPSPAPAPVARGPWQTSTTTRPTVDHYRIAALKAATDFFGQRGTVEDVIRAAEDAFLPWLKGEYNRAPQVEADDDPAGFGDAPPMQDDDIPF